MFDLSQILIAKAWAQAAAPASGTETGGALTSMINLPFLIEMALLFLVFYVVLIRPQQKTIEEQKRMIAALKRGDRVITNGGLYGKVTKLEDDTLMIEIADGVNVKVVRSQVQALAAKTDTGTVANDSSEEKKN